MHAVGAPVLPTRGLTSLAESRLPDCPTVIDFIGRIEWIVGLSEIAHFSGLVP